MVKRRTVWVFERYGGLCGEEDMFQVISHFGEIPGISLDDVGIVLVPAHLRPCIARGSGLKIG
jgi:hypothetical protein